MTSTKILTLALSSLALLGCTPQAPSTTPGERALANLAAHLKRNAMAQARAVSCDNGGVEQRTLTCHVNLVQTSGDKERKVGEATFTCETLPGGVCNYNPAATDATALSVAASCGTALERGATVDLADAGPVTLSELTTHDVTGDAWANASFTLQDAPLRLTETQVRKALNTLGDRVANVCGATPLNKLRVFLYPAGVTAGESANWIARLDDPGSGRQVEIHRQLLKDERADRYACVKGKAPGKDLDLGTRLPPERQREVIGTWVAPLDKVTMSLERAGGKVYLVYRDAHCGSGGRGEPLRTLSDKRYAIMDSRNGDYFQVLPSGDLGVFDRNGRIDTVPRHEGLYPAPAAE